MFRNYNDRRTEKKLAFLSVTARKPGTGGQDVETRVRAKTHETTIAKPSNEPSMTERARVALACAWMQTLRGGRKHSTTSGKAARMAARVASQAWTLAMSHRRIHACPSLLGFSTLSMVAVSFRSVAVVAQPFSDVTW